MTHLAALLLVLVSAASCTRTCPPCAATAPPASAPAAAAEVSMRAYVVAFLEAGPALATAGDDEKRAALSGHRANIEALVRTGQLVVAGPFDAPEGSPFAKLAGIFILDVENVDEARALVATDPAIAAGIFTAELVPWYGPAGLTYTGRPR